ncbi:MAG: hypothetical protein RLZZ244_113, partial [Verrucomicrobiota bacterium]
AEPPAFVEPKEQPSGNPKPPEDSKAPLEPKEPKEPQTPEEPRKPGGSRKPGASAAPPKAEGASPKAEGASPKAEGAPAKAQSVAEIAKAARPSLVKITQIGREGDSGVGSGFVIRSDGLIATNRHVIGEARRMRVETSDGRVHEVTEVLANDARLDLAILRVATRNLPALPLGDSSATVQGAPIVAMGNPQGLAYSVVEGVVSEPDRDVEGTPMIQVAVPIERGNSGGPLLDRQGRVLGVLTLKAAYTPNLGFAMPVNALKELLEKPNPIPMDRWLTIGVLNPQLWKPLLGASWTQRAGVIQVSQPGDGFGGRSLCLWKPTPPSPASPTDPSPEQPFEVSVSVWLEDESGAAGLAFCSDGDQRHYGFYPTGGKLRLTRFDGPNVFSWRVLREVSSEAYRPGDWNSLRVRIEGETIRCFVNDTLVTEAVDGELRGGMAGLCKFRQTSASFKRFRVGESAPPSLAPEAQTAFRETLDALLQPAPADRETLLAKLLQNPAASESLMIERQRELEKAAASLTELRASLHRRATRESLSSELAKPESEPNLLRCALLLSKHDNPELDVESYEHAVSQMARELQPEIARAEGTEAKLAILNRYLFSQSGFHGIRSGSSRPGQPSRSDSYINEVLDDREGLPITLSVVYLELARHLGLSHVSGIPLPSRFMVGFRESPEDEFSLVDVFDGGKRLSMQEAIDLVSETGRVPARSKQPASKRDIIVRMTRNLLGSLEEKRKASKDSLPYLDLILALDPEASSERVTRAMLREKSGDKPGALEDVRWLREHLPDSISPAQIQMLESWAERLAP